MRSPTLTETLTTRGTGRPGGQLNACVFVFQVERLVANVPAKELFLRLSSSHEKTRSNRMLPAELKRSKARWTGYWGVSQL